MMKIAENLVTLTEQLNKHNLVREADVVGSQVQLFSAVYERLNLQSSCIDVVSESAHEAHKTTQDNAEMLNTLLVGIENLGENVK